MVLKQLCSTRSNNSAVSVLIYSMENLFLFPHLEEMLESEAIAILWQVTVFLKDFLFSTKIYKKQVFGFLG